MFNFLCGYNVTPNFSDGDLGEKILPYMQVYAVYDSFIQNICCFWL